MLALKCPLCRSLVNVERRDLRTGPDCPHCGQALAVPTLPSQESGVDVLAPWTVGEPRPHRGSLILTMGIASLFTAPMILGPMAWQMGSADLRAMKAGEMDPSGEGMTQAGRICGLVATVLCGISLLVGGLLVALILAAATMH